MVRALRDAQIWDLVASLPEGWTPWSATAGTGSPAARSSGSRSPACCSRHPGSSCSTRRPRTSTPSPSWRCSGPSTAPWRAGPPSSSRTGCRPSARRRHRRRRGRPGRGAGPARGVAGARRPVRRPLPDPVRGGRAGPGLTSSSPTPQGGQSVRAAPPSTASDGAGHVARGRRQQEDGRPGELERLAARPAQRPGVAVRLLALLAPGRRARSSVPRIRPGRVLTRTARGPGSSASALALIASAGCRPFGQRVPADGLPDRRWTARGRASRPPAHVLAPCGTSRSGREERASSPSRQSPSSVSRTGPGAGVPGRRAHRRGARNGPPRRRPGRSRCRRRTGPR